MNSQNREHRIGALFFRKCMILVLPCIIVYLYPLQVLTVIGQETANTYIGVSNVSIRWQHSVEKEEWEEFYVIDEGDILLSKTRFKTFGAGVPSDVGTETFIKDGWVYMTGIDRSIGNRLDFRTGKTTEHRIIIDGQSNKLKANSSYYMTVKQLNLIQALLYKIRRI